MDKRRDSTTLDLRWIYAFTPRREADQETPRYTGANTFNSREILAPPSQGDEEINT